MRVLNVRYAAVCLTQYEVIKHSLLTVLLLTRIMLSLVSDELYL